MQIKLLPDAKKDFDYWKKTGNKIILKKITQLIENMLKTPHEGLGKPEALKHELTGLWSRRINKEHRIIYEIEDDFLIIHSLKGHYES